MSITLAGGAEFPRFDAIQAVGSTILGLGIVLHLAIQFYRQVSGQSADVVAPLLRGLLGFALLAAADSIGVGLYHAAGAMAEGIAPARPTCGASTAASSRPSPRSPTTSASATSSRCASGSASLRCCWS